MDIYTYVDNFELEKITDIEHLNTLYSKTININGAAISKLNVLQYLAYKIYKKENYPENKSMLISLIRLSNSKILNHRDSHNNTLMHYSAMINDVEIMTELLEKEVVNSANKNDKTPQMLTNDESIKKLLIKHTESLNKIEVYNKTQLQSIIKQDKLGEYTIYHFDSQSYDYSKNMVDLTQTEESGCRFPGKLFVIFDKASQLVVNDQNTKSVIFCLKNSDYVNFTESYDISEEVTINELLSVPINQETSFVEVKVYNCIWSQDKSVNTKKIGYCYLDINEEFIKQCENQILTYNANIVPYAGMFGCITKIFAKPSMILENVQLKIAYIPDDEVKYVEAPIPSTTHSLYNWMVIRKIRNFLWFKGYCHLKGISSILWKRRFIKWQGIHLLIYNEYTNKNVGDINMTRINKSNISFDTSKSYLRIEMVSDERLEVSFDSVELFQNFMASLKYFIEI